MLKRAWNWLKETFSEDSEDDFEETKSVSQKKAEKNLLPERRGKASRKGAPEGTAPRLARATKPLRISIYAPREFSDARGIAKALDEGRIAVVSLSETDTALAQRITDFVSGAVFLLQGTMQLHGDVLVCAPNTVRVEREDFRLGNGDMPIFWRMRE